MPKQKPTKTQSQERPKPPMPWETAAQKLLHSPAGPTPPQSLKQHKQRKGPPARKPEH